MSAGAVDDEQISVGVPAAHNADMGIIWVKHKVSGQGLTPVYGGSVAVLRRGSSAVADDVTAARLIIEYPIDE